MGTSNYSNFIAIPAVGMIANSITQQGWNGMTPSQALGLLVGTGQSPNTVSSFSYTMTPSASGDSSIQVWIQCLNPATGQWVPSTFYGSGSNALTVGFADSNNNPIHARVFAIAVTTSTNNVGPNGEGTNQPYQLCTAANLSGTTGTLGFSLPANPNSSTSQGVVISLGSPVAIPGDPAE